MGKLSEAYVLEELKDTKEKLQSAEVNIQSQRGEIAHLKSKFNYIRDLVIRNMELAALDETKALEVDVDYEYIFRLYSTLGNDFSKFCELLEIDPAECFNYDGISKCN